MMERTVESSTNVRLLDLDVLGSFHGKRYGKPSTLVSIWTKEGGTEFLLHIDYQDFEIERGADIV